MSNPLYNLRKAAIATCEKLQGSDSRVEPFTVTYGYSVAGPRKGIYLEEFADFDIQSQLLGNKLEMESEIETPFTVYVAQYRTAEESEQVCTDAYFAIHPQLMKDLAELPGTIDFGIKQGTMKTLPAEGSGVWITQLSVMLHWRGTVLDG